ncbi:hypothetical protein KJ660_00080 [Candidatus Micrarchaeota archaeon]|nr:hypothetical protein [Candidatus Micrarchaeota archaeon]
MARVKEEEKKEFFISQRKKIGRGITNAPVWIIQKKGERIWNKKQKRNWKQIDLGKMYKKSLKGQGKEVK